MTRARRIPKLGVGDGPLAVSTLGVLGGAEVFALYPARVESGSLVYEPLVAKDKILYPARVESDSAVYAPRVGEEYVPVGGGGWRRIPWELREPWAIYPKRVESHSLVFWPLVIQNPPRDAREREEEDAIALMF